MFNHTTEHEDIKDYAQKIMNKRKKKHIDKINQVDEAMKDIDGRDIVTKLKQWRLKERKHDFEEKINQLSIRENLPKSVLQNKLKALDLYADVLQEKDGDKEVEEKLGVRITNHYRTLEVEHELLPGQSPPKDKTYTEKKKERSEQEQKHQEEIDELLNKLHEEKKLRKEKKRERKQKELERKLRQETKMKDKEEKEKKEIEEKRNKIQETIEKQRELRQQEINKMLELTRHVNKHPMYQRLQEKSKLEEESEMEKRKRHLQSLRDLHKPLDHEDLLEHSKKMDELVRAKIELKRKEREDRIEQQKLSYDYSKYQTRFLENVLEQDNERLEKMEQREEERRNIQEKRNIYYNYVWEMHKPKVSEKKRMELEHLKDNFKTTTLKSKKSPKSIYGSENHPGRGDEISTRHNARANSDQDVDHSIKRKKIIWPENSMKPKPKEEREKKIIDYLKDQRVKHEFEKTNGQQVHSTKNQDWKKDLQKMDLHGKEKYDMYIGKAKDFEDKAKRKQEIIGATQGATIEDIIELNDMYVESIKAKLELLNDFN